MFKRAFLILILSLTAFHVNGQESTTPFKKGLWLTGLDGFISSTNNTLSGNSRNNFNTAYGFSVSSSKIIKDRWTAGLILNANRASSNGVFNRQSESIFIGPSIRHFFSAAPQGSLYLELSPGYVRFFEKSEAPNSTFVVSESVDGNGFGMAMRFGYAHVIDESVVFNFGMNVSNFWILADRSIQGNAATEEQLQIGSIAFNFGFSVLLKKFFF